MPSVTANHRLNLRPGAIKSGVEEMLGRCAPVGWLAVEMHRRPILAKVCHPLFGLV